VVGGHRDAWGPGARDNVSGTVSVLEAARAFATLARDGQKPARTVVFATWDAEEWGLIGSTEWVEEMEDSLKSNVVAYINEDGFSGAGSPSLKPLFRSTAKAVPDPVGPGSVYDVWLKSKNGDTTALTMGNLGGGSDFAGFYHHLGIPSGGIGFITRCTTHTTGCRSSAIRDTKPIAPAPSSWPSSSAGSRTTTFCRSTTRCSARR
jgi:N-acetylated-alpha-linked acidic dipeptidase